MSQGGRLMVGRWADVSRREADGGQVGRCLKEGG